MSYCLRLVISLWTSGVTFSFFWKIQDLSPKKQLKPINQSNNQESFQDDSPKSQQTQAFGKKVTSHGFQIYSDEREGFVEVYTHEDSKVWKARIKPPGIHHCVTVWFLTKKHNEGAELCIYYRHLYGINNLCGCLLYTVSLHQSLSSRTLQSKVPITHAYIRMLILGPIYLPACSVGKNTNKQK